MRRTFRNNLLRIISNKYDLTEITPYFSINTIFEENTKYNSIDDMARLWLLTEENIEDRFFSLEEVTNFLCIENRFCPLWIEIDFIKIANNIALFKLNISMRFRKFSQLKHKESGYPPFIFKS